MGYGDGYRRGEHDSGHQSASDRSADGRHAAKPSGDSEKAGGRPDGGEDLPAFPGGGTVRKGGGGIYWDRREELELSQTEWRKVSERIKADLKSFSRDKNSAESIEENLKEATRERYDYAGFLKKFMAMGESIQVNDDEFDYIYYTYGLDTYGNMPLVEPLEYKDSNKIRDFVIALDTSASCRGEIVQAFLQKTYNIMQDAESFFTKINVHIIQCDSEVQKDVKITEREEFNRFMEQGKLTGFGSTDFRPVFSYVEKLREEGELARLKGMIYFTDWYGIYPEQMPDYDVAFVFLHDDDNAPQVPPWAIRLVLEEEEILGPAQEKA